MRAYKMTLSPRNYTHQLFKNSSLEKNALLKKHGKEQLVNDKEWKGERCVLTVER